MLNELIPTMKNWWNSLSLATKINIPIQVMLVIVLTLAHYWELENIKDDILSSSEKRAGAYADEIINGMNMLMVTNTISNPDNRRLLITKMGASQNVKELRVIRAKQVQDQFGPGLPEEQIRDDMDRLAIESKRSQLILSEEGNTPTVRAVVPFIVSTNFRGTNCLSCHHVEVGSVNGAASIILDVSDEFKTLRHQKALLWLGQIALQILLFFSIFWLINRLMSPLAKMQSMIEAMQYGGSIENFAPIKLDLGRQDEIAKLTSSFNQMSEIINDAERSMKLASLIYQSNVDAIIVTNDNNRIVDVNQTFTRITGYALDEVLGQDPKIFQSGRHDKEFYKKMWQSILEEGGWHGKIWSKRKNGEIFLESSHIQVLRRPDGSVFRHVAQFSDITENDTKDELIFWQANYDLLTNLPNRRLLTDRLAHALASRNRKTRCGALMFLHLDQFKTLNDSLGHELGDLLLAEVAERLKGCVREADTVARFGSGFAILAENISESQEEAKQQAENIAEKIRTALAAPYMLKQNEYISSSSVGVCLYDDKDTSVDDVLKHAQIAMNQASHSGGNTVRFYDPAMQILATHLGRYEIIEELGRGEMGVVYKAHDPLIERFVAIKAIDLLRLSQDEKEEYEARFYQEAKAAGRLNHPNIITIHDLGKSGDMVYIAMELMEGPELQNIISANLSLTVTEKLEIALQVAIGLAYAHQHGIVHRDIKPSNIVVLRDNHVKIADFGIAQVPNSLVKTRVNKILGSPSYMSPEQIQFQPTDARSDIFSFGVVIYQMLTGKLPFKGDNIMALMYQIVGSTPQNPSSLNPENPTVLDAIVLKCLAKKPEDRYQNANDLVTDLNSCLGVPHTDVIDLSALSELVGENKKEVKELVNRFLNSSRKDIKGIEAALERKDFIAIKEFGDHAGAPAAILGATGFANLCRELEHHCRNGADVMHTQEIISQMHIMLNQINERVNNDIPG